MRYAICSLILVLAGCGVRPPIEGRADPYLPPQITLASPELANFTAIGVPIIERRNGGILYVTVPIRSASDYDLHIDYRVTFLDRIGHPIYQSGWEGGKTLVRNIPDQITFNSPTPQAADWHLDLRYAQ